MWFPRLLDVPCCAPRAAHWQVADARESLELDPELRPGVVRVFENLVALARQWSTDIAVDPLLWVRALPQVFRELLELASALSTTSQYRSVGGAIVDSAGCIDSDEPAL